MSWSVSAVGRADKLAGQVKTIFEKTQGCPTGSAEEQVKNAIGEAVRRLCESMQGSNNVVRVEASGSAWTDTGTTRAQTLNVKFETIYNFVE